MLLLLLLYSIFMSYTYIYIYIHCLRQMPQSHWGAISGLIGSASRLHVPGAARVQPPGLVQGGGFAGGINGGGRSRES